MSRSAFATFTSFESQRSSPPNVGAQSNQQEEEQLQNHHRNHPISPTVYNNNNSNNPASFPSPTLTNPDMILPYDIERESSTPSPPFRPLQLPSPEHSGYRRTSVQADNGMHVSSAGIGVALSATNGAPHNYQQRNPPPRNNWMYVGHEVRPPLSDIGEEDSPTRSRWDGDDEDVDVNDMSLGSAPVLEPQWRNNGDQVRGNTRDCDPDGDDDDCSAAEDGTASCSASSSTISAPSEILDRWEEFRTDTGNGNTLSGTRPENSTQEPNQRRSQETDSFSQDIAGVESVEDKSGMRAIREEGEMDGELDEEIDDEISSAMLSKEAERILENAKKRLTHMEGNLSRARTSFRMSPSPSLLAGTLPLSHRQSTGNMGRPHSITERRAQTSLAGALMRQRISQDLNASSSHSRGLSDISVQSSQNSVANRDYMRPPFRSFSALGSTNASGFGASDISNSHDRFEPRATYKSSVSTFNYIPEDLSEPIGNKVSQSDSPHSKPDLLPAQQGNNSENNPPGRVNGVPKISSVEEFNATYPASIPSRSQSQLQVRGLQDQMQDLKSKISTLKVQAQKDNLRRRSLQSLRTPSPFTAAEQWYTSAGEYVGARGKGADVSRNDQNNERKVGGTVDQLRQTPATTDPSPAPEAVEEPTKQTTSDRDRPDDQKSIVGSLYEDADEEFDYDDSDDIDRAALAEILNEPLDSPVSSDDGIYEDFPPVPAVSETTRHEDREDAFDYEHFFLHSALGNYSREKAYQRRQSYSSTGSVETTRPGSQATVYLDTSPRGRHRHARNNSADTISTTASFETATEGADYDYDEDSGDEIEKALYGAVNGNGMKYSHSDLQFRQQYQDPQTTSRHQTRQTIISANGSVSPTPLSTASTPRASGKKANYNTTKGNKHHRSHSRQHSNDASTSLRETVAHLRSPTGMVSSLISSAATQLYKSESQDEPLILDAQLGADDTKLMEGLLQSLGTVALQLQLSTNNSDKRSSADERSSILFRRRLDAAKRVLEGQLDV